MSILDHQMDPDLGSYVVYVSQTGVVHRRPACAVGGYDDFAVAVHGGQPEFGGLKMRRLEDIDSAGELCQNCAEELASRGENFGVFE